MISVTPSLFVHKIPTFFFFFTTTTATTRRSNPSFPAFSVRSSSGLQGIVDKSQKSRGELGPELFSSAPLPATKEAKRVVLVRHGQSTWNEEGRIQGSSDFSVLTKKGEAQAETSRQMLIDDSFDVCFSSPLIRSKRTAEIIWGSRNEEIITESDLREIDLYSFQGLLKHEGKAKFGAAYRQWQVDAPNFNIDGHYPVRELWARARNFWTKLLAHESKSVLVVAHNAVNQALVATAIGLGTGYFRVLLQSNCGVSVLDFTPRVEGGSPFICLNRLNQNTALQMFFSGGRSIVFSTVLSQDDCDLKPKRQVHLCLAEVLEEGRPVGGSYLYVMDPPRKIQRFKRITRQASYPFSGDQTMNMLGVIQSQKTAELLLDLKVSSIISSPKKACVETAMAISSVQEAADCLGADCVPRYVEMKRTESLDVESILYQSKKDSGVLLSLQPGWLNGFEDTVLSAVWDQSEQAWEYLLKELPNEIEQEKIVVVVGDPSIHIALMGHCLNLTKDWMGSFHLDAGSISVIDFPDGLAGRGVIRCINYTAHLGRWSIPITRSTVDDEEF